MLPRSPSKGGGSRADLTLDVVLHKVLVAAGIGDDFLADYSAKLQNGGVTDETDLAIMTESELMGLGLMRAHCMKIVQYYTLQMRRQQMGEMDSPTSSTVGTPFGVGPGGFPSPTAARPPVAVAAGNRASGASIHIKDFTCYCCMDLVLSPRTIACGHTYCFRCLQSWCDEHSKPTCPLCRAPMVTSSGERFVIPPVNTMLNTVIIRLFPHQAARVQQLAEEQDHRAEVIRQEYLFTRHPPNATLVKILKGSAALGNVSEKLELVMLRQPRAEFLSPSKRWTNSSETIPVRLEGLQFNVSAPQLHAISLHHLNLQSGDAVLDVGCGSCVVTSWAAMLAGPTGRVHGVDLKSDILCFGQRNLEKQKKFLADEAKCKDAAEAASCPFAVGVTFGGMIHTSYLFGVAKAEQSAPISLHGMRFIDNEGTIEAILSAGRTADGRLMRTSRVISRTSVYSTTQKEDGTEVYTPAAFFVFDEVQVLCGLDDIPRLYCFSDPGYTGRRLPPGTGQLLSYRFERLANKEEASKSVQDLGFEDVPADPSIHTVRVSAGDTLIAVGQVRAFKLAPCPVNSDLTDLLDPQLALDSLNTIELFQANALLVDNTLPMCAMKEGYDKIYVGAQVRDKEGFDALCSLMKPGGCMVLPYEGSLTVVRMPIPRGEPTLEQISTVNFSLLDLPTPEQRAMSPPAAFLQATTDEEHKVALDASFKKLQHGWEESIAEEEHMAPSFGDAFYTSCCHTAVRGNIVKQLDGWLGDEYRFGEGRIAILEQSLVTSPDDDGDDSKASPFTYMECSAHFYSVLGCEVKVVQCGCGRPVGMELLNDPLEVGPTSLHPLRKGMTALFLSTLDPPITAPMFDENNVLTVPPDERVCCKRCETFLVSTSYVVHRDRQWVNDRTGRFEAACEVNHVVPDAIVIGEEESVRDYPHGASEGSHRFRTVRCKECDAQLGWQYGAPVNTINSLPEYFHQCRIGLLIANITNVEAVRDPRNATLTALFEQGLGGMGRGINFPGLLQALTGTGGNIQFAFGPTTINLSGTDPDAAPPPDDADAPELGRPNPPDETGDEAWTHHDEDEAGDEA